MQHITRIGQPAHLALPRLSARTFVPENLSGAHDKRDTRRYGGLQPAHGRAAGGAYPHAGTPLHRAVAAQCRRGQLARPAGFPAPVQGAGGRHTRGKRRPPDHRRRRVLDLPRGLHAGAGRRLRHPRRRRRAARGADRGAGARPDGDRHPVGLHPRRTPRKRPQELPAVDRGAVRARVNGLLLEAERDAQHTDQAGVPLRLHLLFVPLDRRAVRADDGSGAIAGNILRAKRDYGISYLFSPIRCSTSARNTTSGWPRR